MVSYKKVSTIVCVGAFVLCVVERGKEDHGKQVRKQQPRTGVFGREERKPLTREFSTMDITLHCGLFPENWAKFWNLPENRALVMHLQYK